MVVVVASQGHHLCYSILVWRHQSNPGITGLTACLPSGGKWFINARVPACLTHKIVGYAISYYASKSFPFDVFLCVTCEGEADLYLTSWHVSSGILAKVSCEAVIDACSIDCCLLSIHLIKKLQHVSLYLSDTCLSCTASHEVTFTSSHRPCLLVLGGLGPHRAMLMSSSKLSLLVICVPVCYLIHI